MDVVLALLTASPAMATPSMYPFHADRPEFFRPPHAKNSARWISPRSPLHSSPRRRAAAIGRLENRSGP